MNKVHLTGWRYGFNKIGVTKTIRAHLGFSLADAKHCTDRVLEGTEVILEVPKTETARTLARELDELGVVTTVASGPHP